MQLRASTVEKCGASHAQGDLTEVQSKKREPRTRRMCLRGKRDRSQVGRPCEYESIALSEADRRLAQTNRRLQERVQKLRKQINTVVSRGLPFFQLCESNVMYLIGRLCHGLPIGFKALEFEEVISLRTLFDCDKWEKLSVAPTSRNRHFCECNEESKTHNFETNTIRAFSLKRVATRTVIEQSPLRSVLCILANCGLNVTARPEYTGGWEMFTVVCGDANNQEPHVDGTLGVNAWLAICPPGETVRLGVGSKTEVDIPAGHMFLWRGELTTHYGTKDPGFRLLWSMEPSGSVLRIWNRI